MVLKRRKLIKRISAIASIVLLLFTFCVSVSGAEYFDNRSYFAYPIFQSRNDTTPDLHIIQNVGIGDKINFVPIFNSSQLITTGAGTSRIYLPLPVIQGKQTVGEALLLFVDNTAANNDRWSTLSSQYTFFTEPFFNMELFNSTDGLDSQTLLIRANSTIANINNNRYVPEFRIYFRYIDENGDFVAGINGKPTSAQRPDWVFYEYGDSSHTYGTYQIDTTVMNLTRPESAKGITVIIEASYYADYYLTWESQPQYSQPYIAYYDFFFEEWDIQEAYSNGYDEGERKGRSEGEEVGFQRGYREASEELVNYNAVSGLIQIAQLPSVFISSMLDFNVFGINILALVKHLFTLLLVAFVTVVFVRYIL